MGKRSSRYDAVPAVSQMGQARAAASSRRKPTAAERDAAYRKALGLDLGQELPGQIGTQSSAGGSRGGRGRAQKGKGRNS
jgi:hypothetical protein